MGRGKKGRDADNGGAANGEAGGSKRGHESGEEAKGATTGRDKGEPTKRDRAGFSRARDKWQCAMCGHKHNPDEERILLAGRNERYDGENC